MTGPIRNIWLIAVVVQGTLGFLIGVYEATCGAYFYERLGSEINSGHAITLATLLLVIRQGLMTFFELPAGALADTIGHRKVVIFSWIVRALFFVSLSALWFCDSVATAFAWGLLASVFWAISYTLFNGAFAAWCVDYLRKPEPEVRFAWLSSRYFNYYAVAFAAGIPAGILFYVNGLPILIYGVLAFLSFVCTIFCLRRMRAPQKSQSIRSANITQREMFKSMRERLIRSVGACREGPILFWIIITFGSYMFLLSLVLFLWPVYLKETTGSDRFSPLWVGIAIIMALLFVVSSRALVVINYIWTKIRGAGSHIDLFAKIYLGSAAASSLAVVFLSWAAATNAATITHLAIAVFTVVFSWGFMGPCFETLINHYIGPEQEGAGHHHILWQPG